MLTDAQAFDGVVPALAQRRTIYRISLPGFGRSTPLASNGSDLTVVDLADCVAATMRALGCGVRTSVLGNGLGAFVSLALAIRHGDRFGALLVANGGATFSAERRTAFGTMSRLVLEGGMAAVVDVAVRRIFPAAYLEAHPEVIDERRLVLERVDAGAFAAYCRALATMDLRGDLAAMRKPTLVLAGQADETTPVEMAEQLAAGIPGARLAVLPGCGHCPPLEQPDAFVDAVESFLAEVESR